MRAGRMDRIVTIRQKSVEQNDFGEEIETWTDLGRIWAGRKNLRGTEGWAARQVVANIEAKYYTRYRDDISVQDRLVDEGIEFKIHSVSEIGRKEGLEIVVSRQGED